MKKLNKCFYLATILIICLCMVGFVQAKPANFKVAMNNQLDESVFFNFKFARDDTDYSLPFGPGKSIKYIKVNDKNLAGTDVKISYKSIKSGNLYNCEVSAISNFNPTIFDVSIMNDYSCEVSLS